MRTNIKIGSPESDTPHLRKMNTSPLLAGTDTLRSGTRTSKSCTLSKLMRVLSMPCLLLQLESSSLLVEKICWSVSGILITLKKPCSTSDLNHRLTTLSSTQLTNG